MKKSLLSLVYLCLLSSSGCINEIDATNIPSDKNDSLSFIWAHKDSIAIQKYGISHKSRSYSITRYDHSFSLQYDSLTHQWLYKDQIGSSILSLEKEETFILNHTAFNIQKLMLDKGVVDGEMVFIVDATVGLLVMKSNTWRYTSYLKTDNMMLSALILRIITSEECYSNNRDSSHIKFVMPRINY